MANTNKPRPSEDADALLAMALEEHDRQLLEALEEEKQEPIGGGGGLMPKTLAFLDECRAKLAKLQQKED